MTHRIDFAIAGVIAIAAVADMLWNDGSAVFFVLRKITDLTEYLAFWR
jgi:hypothetical protein